MGFDDRSIIPFKFVRGAGITTKLSSQEQAAHISAQDSKPFLEGTGLPFHTRFVQKPSVKPDMRRGCCD